MARPAKKAAAKKTTKKRASKTDSTADQQSAALLQLLGPLIKFHENQEDADADDLRLFWDVRLVAGKGEAFAHFSGSSTMSNALDPTLVNDTEASLESEVMNKIAKPLVAKMQNYITEHYEEAEDEIAIEDGEGNSNADARNALLDMSSKSISERAAAQVNNGADEEEA